MDILLHTIALEPARWTPQRSSQPLAEILPAIRQAGFRGVEVFEPHMETAVANIFRDGGVEAVVLSSYLDLSSSNPDDSFASQGRKLLERARSFGFRKVRLFPSHAPVADRLRDLADQSPDLEFLIETHDGSIADDPAAVLRFIDELGRPNVGLLWQPTRFEADAARAQFALQKRRIRHVHLQNRHADLSFAPLSEGIIPWDEFLPELDASVGLTLEFVPSGVVPPQAFRLPAALAQAAQEADVVRRMRCFPSVSRLRIECSVAPPGQ